MSRSWRGPRAGGCPEGRDYSFCGGAAMKPWRERNAPELDVESYAHFCTEDECVLCGTVACGECVLSTGSCPHDHAQTTRQTVR